MKRLGFTTASALVLVALVGCSSNDEALAAKDQVIKEKADENAALQQQVRDLQQTQQIAQTQLEESRRRANEAEAAKLTPVEKGAAKPVAEKEAPKTKSAPKGDAPAVKDADVVTEHMADGGVVLRLSGGAAFNAGSDKLTARGRDAVAKVAAELKRTKGGITVEGHTDASPLTGKNKEIFHDNMNLSLARAVSVKNALVERGVSKDRITVHGHGETKPLEKGTSKAAFAKNRRVEIILHPGE